MRIPVFVSCPSLLNKSQMEMRETILHEMDSLMLEPRSIGTTDYPDDLPLREVYVLSTHCSGGIILGFEQSFAPNIYIKRGTPKEGTGSGKSFPSPWNQLEAGVLYGLGLPLLVFYENNIEGGIFDKGVTDVFIREMPVGGISPDSISPIRATILKWQYKVREHYYRDRRSPNRGVVHTL